MRRFGTVAGISCMLFLLCMTITVRESSAVSKDELLAYQQTMSAMIEEVYFGLEPGSLKRTPLSLEEKQKKMAPVVARIMESFKSSLEIYVKFYKTMTERMSSEIDIRDRSLAEWHAKLTGGYKDSYEITVDALAAEKLTDQKQKEQEYEKKKISVRIQKNADYHHALRSEMLKMIMSEIPDPRDQRDFLNQTGVNQYIELTWK